MRILKGKIGTVEFVGKVAEWAGAYIPDITFFHPLLNEKIVSSFSYRFYEDAETNLRKIIEALGGIIEEEIA